jgi:hypothetical protein
MSSGPGLLNDLTTLIPRDTRSRAKLHCNTRQKGYTAHDETKRLREGMNRKMVEH